MKGEKTEGYIVFSQSIPAHTEHHTKMPAKYVSGIRRKGRRKSHIDHSHKTIVCLDTSPYPFPPVTLVFDCNKRLHIYCSLSTPARPLSMSPTPTPSVPTLSFASRSRSSSLFAAVPSTQSATFSAVARYCSIL